MAGLCRRGALAYSLGISSADGMAFNNLTLAKRAAIIGIEGQ